MTLSLRWFQYPTNWDSASCLTPLKSILHLSVVASDFLEVFVALLPPLHRNGIQALQLVFKAPMTQLLSIFLVLCMIITQCYISAISEYLPLENIR